MLLLLLMMSKFKHSKQAPTSFIKNKFFRIYICSIFLIFVPLGSEYQSQEQKQMEPNEEEKSCMRRPPELLRCFVIKFQIHPKMKVLGQVEVAEPYFKVEVAGPYQKLEFLCLNLQQCHYFCTLWLRGSKSREEKDGTKERKNLNHV